MQITADKLRTHLGILESVTHKKNPSVEALGYALVDDGVLHATDLETSVTVRLPEARASSFLLPLRLTQTLLKRMPGYATVTIASETPKSLAIVADGAKISLATRNVEEYPPHAEMTEVELDATVDGDAFVAALAAVAPYAATDDARPVLTTICLTLGERSEVAAADGYRLAFMPLPFAIPHGYPERTQRLIPRHTAVLIERLWRRWAEGGPESTGGSFVESLARRRPLRLRIGADLLEYAFGRITISARRPEGTFPNYAQLVPAENAHRAEFFAEDLCSAVRLVAPLAHDASGIVRLAWSGVTMTVRARSDAVGEVEGRVALRKPAGEEGAIAFNAKYLLEYLEDKSGPVLLETNNPNTPGVWSVAGQPRVVLMPMFVQQDAPPVPPPPAASPTSDDVTGASDESENDESATPRKEDESEIPE